MTSAVSSCASLSSSSSESRRETQKNVILNRRECGARPGAVPVPAGRVVKVQRRPVIDQPHRAVPHEHVGVSRGAIDVAHERVEPDDARRQIRRHGCERRDRNSPIQAGSRARGSVRRCRGSARGFQDRARCARDRDRARPSRSPAPAARAHAQSRQRSAPPSAPADRVRRLETSDTYNPSSSASTMAGSEPPSRRGVTYRVTATVRSAGTAFIVSHLVRSHPHQ